MKNIKIIGLLFALFVAGTHPVHAAGIKVGVVNASVVLDQSPQKTQALARLEREFSSRSRTLEDRQKSLMDAQQKLNRDRAILSSDEVQAQERKLISDQRELNRMQDEYAEDLSIRRNEELRKLEEEVAQAIIDLAIKDSYDLVLYQGVIFASEAIDMTDKVLEELKRKAN
ncbi:outer membrane chaperone Skp (OmpH)-like protein [Methylophaga lonarensis MPL]|uniref:Outer membrane chaperone Skp (OmpH)-like protein n=1 Tax=Methylophaga lonarensis MPL TaxID=1286106 RepID=M7P3N9_9GAMM|nr:OmpH family outer membrane protein [Methylophaga lonarensis]EMR14132.1 outer membrane chaperone Skp (OmpH)-like protein [Methylophaga lonarensis MPL]